MKAMIKEAIKQNGKLFVRFFVSFVITCLLLTVLCMTASALSAADQGSDEETAILAENPDAEPVDESLLKQLIGIDGSQSLEIILIITILSVAPSFLVMLTSFTRIVIVFSFLRNAMQTQSIPPNSVLMGLSLFLTMFIMWPTIMQINDQAYQPYAAGEITINEMVGRSADQLKIFMLKNTSRSNMQFFLDLKGASVYASSQGTASETTAAPAGTDAAGTTAGTTPTASGGSAETEASTTTTAAIAFNAAATVDPDTTTVPEETESSPLIVTDGSFIPPLDSIEPIVTMAPINLEQTEAPLTDYIDQLGLETVIPAFILSELTRAFQMGFMIFIPFLVIDIVVSSTLMAMGMMMLPPSMISLPFKIMLFVLVDGWQMLVGTLVNSFNI